MAPASGRGPCSARAACCIKILRLLPQVSETPAGQMVYYGNSRAPALCVHHPGGTTVAQQIQSENDCPLTSEAMLALIQKIEAGDSAALIILYDRTSSLLFGLIIKILGSKAHAEEILLDTYTHIWKQSATYDRRHTPIEWLIMVARAHALARLHWEKQDRRDRQAPAEVRTSRMTVEPQQQQLARASMQSLVAMQQEILAWAYCSGLSCSEIAAQIGKPLGAVKTHARLGLMKLYERLGSPTQTARADSTAPRTL